MTFKHKVTTDALDTLGTIIGPGEGRDAVHLAVLPAEAGERLAPGLHVRVAEDGRAITAPDGQSIGIVDPFLPRNTFVEIGQRFWLVVYPRVITSLRHVWSHPQVPDEAAEPTRDEKVADSEAWLRRYVEENDSPFSYDQWLKIARGEPLRVEGYEDWPSYRHGYNNDGEYLTSLGRDAAGEIPKSDALWLHLERITGVPQRKRAQRFSCSC